MWSTIVSRQVKNSSISKTSTVSRNFDSQPLHLEEDNPCLCIFYKYSAYASLLEACNSCTTYSNAKSKQSRGNPKFPNFIYLI